MASEGFHELPQDLSPQTRDMHRAILSLMRQSTEGGGYPAAKQLRIALEKVHNSPTIDGAVVLSTRGNDFLVTVGGDLTVGYRAHDDTSVHLFCVETVAAQLLTPEAVCIVSRES